MNNETRKKQVNHSESIERQLDNYLHPVVPDQDFVKGLRKHLFIKSEITVEYPNYLYLIFFICLSFISGIFIIFLINRLALLFKGNSSK